MPIEFMLRAVPVHRGPENGHLSYVGSLLFGDIARLLDDGHLYVPNEPDLPDFAQRKPNPVRVKAIARYILETYREGSTFFPPICVNVQPVPDYREGMLHIPYHSIVLRLTDGQHRCLGIRQALKDAQNECSSTDLAVLSQLEVGVLLYAALPLDLERQAFRDQNLLAQRPGTSLAHAFDQRLPAVLIAKVLLNLVPQFCNNVEMAENGLGKHNPKLLTFATLVTATQHMFPNLKSKEGLEQMVDWAGSFWTATASVLPEDAWQVQTKVQRTQQRQESLVGTAVVFQALGMLAHDLYVEGVPSAELPKWLSNLREVDWRRDNPFWRERGVTQVGAQNDPIISNTRTTISACHKALSEFVGVASVSGVA